MTGSLAPETEAPARPKGSDARFVALTALVIVALGVATAMGIRWIAGGGDTGDAAATNCPAVQPLGVARLIRNDPDIALIPQYRQLGRGCDLWLALVDGEVVAVKGTQPSLGCTVRPDAVTERWTCNGEIVSIDDLDRWPLETREVNGEPGILVALLDE